MTEIEYRLRPVTRFVLTRYDKDGSKPLGEFDNADLAYEAGHAMAFEERETLGWPPGDERIKFPDRWRDTELSVEEKQP